MVTSVASSSLETRIIMNHYQFHGSCKNKNRKIHYEEPEES